MMGWLLVLAASSSAPDCSTAEGASSEEAAATKQHQAALIDAINSGWNWTGTSITEIHRISPMGHMILSDADGQFYYLDTDGMRLTTLGDEAATDAYLARPEACEVWSGGELVKSARARLGDPAEGYTFTLAPQNWIDGDYRAENMVILPLSEVAFASGDLARQLKGLPEGAQVQIKVVD